MTQAKTSQTPELDQRAQHLLRSLVARYIRDGQPVGSRTLTGDSGLDVSPATVRNVMADLEALGFVHSPHTSAGRVPTVRGYRFFVDSLLNVRPLTAREVATLRGGLDVTQPAQQLVNSASAMLSAVTSFVGLVTVPRRDRFSFQMVEFVRLKDNRVLAVLVFSDGDVQNRIIDTPHSYSQAELQRVANYLNRHYAGRTLGEVRAQLLKELRETREQLYRIMGRAIDVAESAFAGNEQNDLVVAGESNLLDCADLSDMEKLRGLFDTFHRKRDLLSLMERCIRAEGVRLFIGEESGYRALGECSVVTAPYASGGQTLGVLGVIGPTRMAYDRVIPVVDATARMLGAALRASD